MAAGVCLCVYRVFFVPVLCLKLAHERSPPLEAGLAEQRVIDTLGRALVPDQKVCEALTV